MSEPVAPDDEPDIVRLVLQRVVAAVPGMDVEVMERIEQEVRAQYGGSRVRIPKRGKYLTPEQRRLAYTDALTNMPTREILAKHKISLATLKRLVKQGPGDEG